MTTLTILPSGKTFEFEAGTNLLKAIIEAGEKLITKCGGEAKCGACHLYLTEGRKGASKLTAAENAKLDTLVGIGSKSRLACQVTLLGTEPVTVEILSV